MKRSDEFGNIKQWTWDKARTTTAEKTGWLLVLQLLIATILHLNHKIILPGWCVSKYFLEKKYNVNRVELAEKAKKGIVAFLDSAWKPHTSTGNISVRRGTEIKREKMKPRDGKALWKRDKGARLCSWEDTRGFRTALDRWDSEVLLWAERPVPQCCPKAGGFDVPRIQIWAIPTGCHKQQWGPEPL